MIIANLAGSGNGEKRAALEQPGSRMIIRNLSIPEAVILRIPSESWLIEKLDLLYCR